MNWKTILIVVGILAAAILLFIFIKKQKEKEIYCGNSKSAMKKVISEFFKNYWTSSMLQYLINLEKAPSTNYDWYENIRTKATASGVTYAEQVPYEVKYMWENNNPKLSGMSWKNAFIQRFIDEKCNSDRSESVIQLINETLK